MPQLKNRHGKGQGFTLIELSAVIFLLALIAVIAIPAVRDFTDLNLRSGAMRLSGTMRYVFNLAAMDRPNRYRISISLKEEKWAIEHLDNTKVAQGVVEYSEDRSSFGRGLVLPTGVHFRDILLAGERISPEITEKVYINFLPSGYVQPVLIYLQNKKGDVYTVTINSLTGITKIFDREIVPEDIYGNIL